MGRNKYIYCLSEAAIVVHSGLKGGTWTGANENLKKKWVLLYVRENNDKESGNLSLIKNGGIAINDNTDIRSLIANTKNKNEMFIETSRVSTVHEPKIKTQSEKNNEAEYLSNERQTKTITDISFYELFIIKLSQMLNDKELKQKELKEKMSLTTSQFNEWLNRVEAEGIVQKLSKPARYKLVNDNKSQDDLFS